MITSYQRTLIYKAAQIRMKEAKEKELKHLAESMGIPIEEVKKTYDEEAEKRLSGGGENE